MKAVFYLIFCSISYCIFFGFNKYNFTPKGWYIILPPILITIPIILFGLIAKRLEIQLSREWINLLFSVMLSSIILSISVFFKFIIPRAFNIVLNFHKTYNIQNIDKNPVKFFITYHYQLVSTLYIIAFLASFIMFYGAFWGQNK